MWWMDRPRVDAAHAATPTRVFLAIAGVLCATCFVLQVFAYWHYVNDDAYITFRYSARRPDVRAP